MFVNESLDIYEEMTMRIFVTTTLAFFLLTSCGVKTTDENSFKDPEVTTEVAIQSQSADQFKSVKDALKKVNIIVEFSIQQALQLVDKDAREDLDASLSIIKNESDWIINSVIEASAGKIEISNDRFVIERTIIAFGEEDSMNSTLLPDENREDRRVRVEGHFKDERVTNLNLTVIRDGKEYLIYSYEEGQKGKIDFRQVARFLLRDKVYVDVDQSGILITIDEENGKVVISKVEDDVSFQVENVVLTFKELHFEASLQDLSRIGTSEFDLQITLEDQPNSLLRVSRDQIIGRLRF